MEAHRDGAGLDACQYIADHGANHRAAIDDPVRVSDTECIGPDSRWIGYRLQLDCGLRLVADGMAHTAQ